MDEKSRRYAMILAFGMVIYPSILVLGMGRFQAGVLRSKRVYGIVSGEAIAAARAMGVL